MTETLDVTAVALRDKIAEALDDAVQDAGQNGPDEVDISRQLNRIMNAVGEYVDAIITRRKEHVCIADIHAGPALVYIHTDGKTMTDVDRVAINGDPEPIGYARERAISRALITEALRLLNDSEQS